MKSKAWIACPLVAVALVGCKSETEPVSQVPPPTYAAEPEPLPPVSVNEGTTASETNPGGSIGYGEGQLTPPVYEPEPLPPEPVARTYTIKKGDTLWSIATREYGDGQKWKSISAANPSLDPKKLIIGQQITLP